MDAARFWSTTVKEVGIGVKGWSHGGEKASHIPYPRRVGPQVKEYGRTWEQNVVPPLFVPSALHPLWREIKSPLTNLLGARLAIPVADRTGGIDNKRAVPGSGKRAGAAKYHTSSFSSPGSLPAPPCGCRGAAGRQGWGARVGVDAKCSNREGGSGEGGKGALPGPATGRDVSLLPRRQQRGGEEGRRRKKPLPPPSFPFPVPDDRQWATAGPVFG